jgi:2-alkyl-3-oxoalkanoate reductase
VKALVTGASGFIGSDVVRALASRGHAVRALVRPAAQVPPDWPETVEVFRADLRNHPDLAAAFEGVDVVVHLAAAMGGSEQQQFAGTVVGTERLVDAMARSSTRRMVLASSISVYDWVALDGTLDEAAPLERHFDDRDAYTLTKHYQERVVRRRAEQEGWDVVVLRPGWVWGKPGEYPPRIGRTIGGVHLVFGPRAILPLTHVRNCADYFARAAEGVESASARTINVIDPELVPAWWFMGEYMRRTGTPGRRLPIPYAVVRAIFGTAYAVSRRAFGPSGKLSTFLSPRRFEAGYKPLSYDRRRLEAVLGSPPQELERSLELTYGPRRGAVP